MNGESDPSSPAIVATVGGPVDEVRVSLAVYSDDLDPDLLTRLLGCAPSTFHRRGDRRHERSIPYSTGAWILTEESISPETVNQALRRLLMRLPDDPSLWSRLAEEHRVQLRFGIHMTGWNKGFSISNDALTRLSSMCLTFEFDLYAYDHES